MSCWRLNPGLPHTEHSQRVEPELWPQGQSFFPLNYFLILLFIQNLIKTCAVNLRKACFVVVLFLVGKN